MTLLPKVDYASEADESVLDEGSSTKDDVKKTSIVRFDLDHSRSPFGGQAVSRTVSTVPVNDALIKGTGFWKWGRNGKCKRRFVVFDEQLEAVVWRARETDKEPCGAIHIAKVQDVCSGLQTPVLQQVRSSWLSPELAWSVISSERTLDLQADSLHEQQVWVSGIKACYKRFLQRIMARAPGIPGSQPLPKQLERRGKIYPERYRSDRCCLRSMYHNLQVAAQLDKTLRGGGSGEDPLNDPERADWAV